MVDSNQSFCLRLAQEIFPTLAAYPDSPLVTELRTLFAQTCKPTVPILDSVEHLAAQLEVRPDVQSHLASITEYTPSKWLLERELEAADLWSPGQDAYICARDRDALGVCLSGGGIRSATFNLGILQGLSRDRRLSRIDYLSSVSGGGYIHQFLANWISKIGSTSAVEKLLDPIPNAPGSAPLGARATVPPESLRWLRRYSNYLAPRKGLLTLDTWTIVAVWSRNTVLNLSIVLSSIFFLLLLPHLGTMLHTPFRRHPILSRTVFVLFSALFLLIAYRLFHWIGNSRVPGPRPIFIKLATAIVFLVSCIVAPSVYRSALPGGSSNSPEAIQVYTAPTHPEELHYRSTYTREKATSEHIEVTVDSREPAPESRLRWAARPRPLGSSRQLRNRTLFAFIVLSAVFLCAVTAASDLGYVWIPAFLLVGLLSAYALLEGVRLLFFAAAFFVDPPNISRLGVVLLPALLFGIPFLTLETGVGLLGRSLDSSQREWLARLRAFSFLSGGLWIAFTTFSLFGPTIFGHLAAYTRTGYTIWLGWIVTSVGGVLSARSDRTSSGKAAHSDSPSFVSTVLEFVARIAPLVFLAGLLILMAKVVDLALRLLSSSPAPLYPPTWTAFLLLAGGSFAIAALFGWRVDINDFSMHSFYRDRLARAYAAASTPNREPNQFTGFASDDRSLRVHNLLPVGYNLRDRDGSVIQEGTYPGPFPIVCTAINLTTGEDLAYQERKAASFAFTPLFSGFNVGWTNARDDRNQFNGFVPTRDYVYTRHGGLMFATAVAISGAAASPNMGYHSNPAIAALLTVFNVRLGWWLRNPRRRDLGPTAAPKPAAPLSAPKPNKVPESSPRFGLLRLVNELFGHSDDTTSYVYLTDGGHFDNMGLYELLRRRCRRIIVCDGEADSGLCFEGIGMSIRKARLDFGIEIILNQISPPPP